MWQGEATGRCRCSFRAEHKERNRRDRKATLPSGPRSSSLAVHPTGEQATGQRLVSLPGGSSGQDWRLAFHKPRYLGLGGCSELQPAPHRSLGLSQDREAVVSAGHSSGHSAHLPLGPRSSLGGPGLEKAKALSLEREANRGWATRGLHAAATSGPGEPAQPPLGQVQSTMACIGACVRSHGRRHRASHTCTPKHVSTSTHVLLTTSCGSLHACHHPPGHTPPHTCRTLFKHSVTPPPVQLAKGASVPSAPTPGREAWGSLCPLSLCQLQRPGWAQTADPRKGSPQPAWRRGRALCLLPVFFGKGTKERRLGTGKGVPVALGGRGKERREKVCPCPQPLSAALRRAVVRIAQGAQGGNCCSCCGRCYDGTSSRLDVLADATAALRWSPSPARPPPSSGGPPLPPGAPLTCRSRGDSGL